jgi:hypothetical protein
MYVLNMLGFTHQMWARASSSGFSFTVTLTWLPVDILSKRRAVEILVPYLTVIDGNAGVARQLNATSVDPRVRIPKTNHNAINHNAINLRQNDDIRVSALHTPSHRDSPQRVD